MQQLQSMPSLRKVGCAAALAFAACVSGSQDSAIAVTVQVPAGVEARFLQLEEREGARPPEQSLLVENKGAGEYRWAVLPIEYGDDIALTARGYSAADGAVRPKITLSMDRVGETIEIAVADRGPGVAVADRGRALQRFVRLEKSRSRPGSGLGLSLVAAVARLHGGSIRLEDNVNAP